jgi:two-component system nitrogen regulation sensor histidine kinase NtrY
VRLAKDPSARKVTVSVADEGPGIKEEDRERLFLPYFSTKKDGTGLGLAIADKIVADHGGSIKVRDNAPRGSVFAIELPIKEV